MQLAKFMEIFLVAILLLFSVGANCLCRSLTNNENATSDYTSLFGITNPDEALSPSGIAVNQSDGSIISRLKHTYDGIEVWGSGATVFVESSTNVRGLCAEGTTKIFGSADPTSLGKRLRSYAQLAPNKPNDSVALCKKRFSLSFYQQIRNQTVTSFIYSINETSYTHAHRVELVGDDKLVAKIFRVFCMVDTVTKKVLEAWNGLENYYGVGGNAKTNKYRYGVNRSKLPATPVTGSNSNCAMQNPSKTLAIHNLKSTSNAISPRSTPAATYNCQNGADDETNEGYSPLNDCFFNADQATRMLLDPDWGLFSDMDKYTPDGVFHVGVHFKRRYDNAFWDGSALYFGDGAVEFYPLCTCTDIVAHEMGHSVTQMLSDLAYSGEAGCINEAFSDMMGEAVENYFKNGTNDFKIGVDCMKSDPYLRDMSQQRTYATYRRRDDPHACSGIFNHAFYKLATSPGWNTKTAFRVFLMANALFWRQNTAMKQAACDVAAAASKANLGGDINAVVSAFAAVSIDISGCVPSGQSASTSSTSRKATTSLTTPSTTEADVTTADYTFFPTFFPTRRRTGRTITLPPTTSPSTRTTTVASTSTTDGQLRIVTLKNCAKVSGLSGSKRERLYFRINVPDDADFMDVTIVGQDGDADLYIKIGSLPTTTSYDWRPYLRGSYESEIDDITETGTYYYVMIYAAQAFSDLSLWACFI